MAAWKPLALGITEIWGLTVGCGSCRPHHVAQRTERLDDLPGRTQRRSERSRPV